MWFVLNVVKGTPGRKCTPDGAGANGDGPRRAAKLRRRNSVGRLERPRERRVRLITRVQRHLDHLLRARPQFHRRPLQPQPPHMVRNRLTCHRREDAMKMKTRKTGHLRQLLQIQRLIQMLLDMRQHPQNALLIIIPRCLMLWPCAAHLPAKLANAITGRLTNFAVLPLRHFKGGNLLSHGPSPQTNRSPQPALIEKSDRALALR